MGVVTTLPRNRALTRADLEMMPDDGHRYELIDGILIVSPAPSHRHQRASMRLSVVLATACPAGLEVLAAPFAVALADDTELQPDLIVARQVDFTPCDLPTAPLLAVEIASPSTRLYDRNLKKARLEKAGCPSFWIVDPTDPRLTVWELRDGVYVEVADVVGDESWTTTTPFEVTITPSALVGSVSPGRGR